MDDDDDPQYNESQLITDEQFGLPLTNFETSMLPFKTDVFVTNV